MLTTVWLILTAMMFGSVLETTGILRVLAGRMLERVRGTSGLILTTLGTSFGINVLASDQYISIVLPGRMFRSEYERRGLDPKNLSRTLEDAGTLTSPLIPWNTCGAFMATTLGSADAHLCSRSPSSISSTRSWRRCTPCPERRDRAPADGGRRRSGVGRHGVQPARLEEGRGLTPPI